MLILKNLHLLKTNNLVNGKWIESTTGEVLDVINPATDEIIAHIFNIDITKIDKVINVANKAQKLWSRVESKERTKYINQWHDLLLANVEDLAKIITAEQGKPLAESRQEIVQAASFLLQLSLEGEAITDRASVEAKENKVKKVKEPIGVCAAITSSDSPAAIVIEKVGAALAAGCSVILKPASETPLTALAIGQLAIDAGIPAGVINIITGSAKKIAAVLINSHLVHKVTFTGSSAAGQALIKNSDDRLTKVTFELRDSPPLIVFSDADLNVAVEGLMRSKFHNAGQSCLCANRIYVHADIYVAFIKKLISQMQTIKIGSGTEEGTNLGPLINFAAIERIEKHIRDLLAKGGRLATGGSRHFKGDRFYQPTIIIDATMDMLVAHEEVFGPLVPIFKFESDAEVVLLANSRRHGQMSYVYSTNTNRIARTVAGLDSDFVGVNLTKEMLFDDVSAERAASSINAHIHTKRIYVTSSV